MLGLRKVQGRAGCLVTGLLGAIYRLGETGQSYPANTASELVVQGRDQQRDDSTHLQTALERY